jgi:hypothetical protein
MKAEFEMIDLGMMNYFLGIEVNQLKMVFLFVKKSMKMTY